MAVVEWSFCFRSWADRSEPANRAWATTCLSIWSPEAMTSEASVSGANPMAVGRKIE